MVMNELGFNPAEVSPHRIRFALGRLANASFAAKAFAELHRTGGHNAPVAMCIGGKQGIAVISNHA